MSLKDITITGSIGSIATQSYGQKTYISSTDDQSFPLEHVTGSYAGSWPNFPLRGLNTSNSASNTTVGLVVNVTQSWPGSNTTPLGIVPYVHNTMEEFINGEFSGSSYVVTDGSLTDAQCEQFLTVNTTPVNYNVFSFYKNSTQDPANVYLNRNTAPLNGQIYIYYYNYSGGNTYGVYAKIARIDALGHDNTLSLQELKQFRYTDSSTSEKIIFDVININEYPDYYFYEVVSNTTLAVPSFGNVVNHSLSARYTSSVLPSSGFTFYPFPSSSGNWSKTIDNLNYFNDYNSGIYIFGDTPNVELQYTASFKFTTTQNNQIVGYAIANTSNPSDPISALLNASVIYLETPFTVSSAGTTLPLDKRISGFFQNVKTYGSLLFYYSNYPLNNVTASLIITQSVAAQQSTSSFVISPYLLSTFTNSDCDVLMNNADLNDVSTFYREVLYDNGGTTPSNLQQIISGTAEYAQINDYLYNANANVLPRYQGVRTTSNNFNLPSVNGLTNEELSNLDPIKYPSNLVIDKGVSNVEQTTTYFAYFTSLKSNNPIFKGTTSPVIKYLIKEDGTVFNPATDSTTFDNLQGSFEVGKKAYTNLLNNTTLTFNNTHSILFSGQSYTPILYTISASNSTIATYTDTIDFDNLQGNASNPVTPTTYSFQVGAGNNIYVSFPSQNTPYNAFRNSSTIYALLDHNGGWQPTYGSSNVWEPYYEFLGIPNVEVTILASLDKVYLGTVTGNPAELNATFTIEIWKSNSGGVSSSLAQKDYYAFGNLTNRYLNVNNQGDLIINYVPQIGDQIFMTTKVSGGGSGVAVQNTLLRISTLGIASNPLTNFWTTGSSSRNILSCSVDLTNRIFANYKQVDIPSSGFDPIELPCEIKVGDEIRFEYDEANTFKVLEVNPSGSQIYLTLDRDIPNVTTLNIDHFTVRRKIKDAITGITLDANNNLIIDDGFLLPEYPSETIKKNLPNIVNDLYNRTLI